MKISALQIQQHLWILRACVDPESPYYRTIDLSVPGGLYTLPQGEQERVFHAMGRKVRQLYEAELFKLTKESFQEEKPPLELVPELKGETQ